MGRNPRLGRLLIVIGVVGIVTGVVPFSAMGRWLSPQPGAAPADPGLGLSVEWYILSSSLSAYLGGLLIWAGVGWMRGRGWATLATWVYVSCGITVNVTDLVIFVLQAAPGHTRTMMFIADGIALLIPLSLTGWLLARRRAAGEPSIGGR